MALCTQKFDFLAKKLEGYFKNYGSGRSKEGICRIMGSLSRWECVEVRRRFDRGAGEGPVIHSCHTHLSHIHTIVHPVDITNPLIDITYITHCHETNIPPPG